MKTPIRRLALGALGAVVPLLPLRAADAAAEVDRILAEVVQAHKSTGSPPADQIQSSDVAANRPASGAGLVVTPPVREDSTPVLLGQVKQRFWGTDTGNQSFDLRFDQDGKGWTYTRTLGPDGSVDNDEEPRPVQWAWETGFKLVVVTDANSHKASYKLVQEPPDQPALELQSSDPNWSGRRVLRRRDITLGVNGEAMPGWKNR